MFAIFALVKNNVICSTACVEPYPIHMCRLNLHFCCHWSRSESARKSKSAATIIWKVESASGSELIRIQLCVTCMCCPNLNFCCNQSQIAWRSKSTVTIIESESASESGLIQIQLCVTCMCCPNLNFCCKQSKSENAGRSKSAGTIIESESEGGLSAMTVTSNWSGRMHWFPRQLYLTSFTKSYHSCKSRNHMGLQILYCYPLISLLLR